jgi:hypothetical protein
VVVGIGDISRAVRKFCWGGGARGHVIGWVPRYLHRYHAGSQRGLKTDVRILFAQLFLIHFLLLGPSILCIRIARETFSSIALQSLHHHTRLWIYGKRRRTGYIEYNLPWSAY